jgi:acylphosphatase
VAELGAFRAEVRGRVQGVGFRYFALSNASRLGICGWVRNLPNGSVEVFAQGLPDRLERFRQALEYGPRAAFVEGVTYNAERPRADYVSFEVIE